MRNKFIPVLMTTIIIFSILVALFTLGILFVIGDLGLVIFGVVIIGILAISTIVVFISEAVQKHKDKKLINTKTVYVDNLYGLVNKK